MSSLVYIGHRFFVAFLTLMFAIGCAGIVWGIWKGTKGGLFIAFISAASCLFSGATAWGIFYWKPLGRYLGFYIVLQHLSFLVNWQGPLRLYNKILTIPVLLMGMWLLVPEVKQKFGPLPKVKWL